MSTTAGGSPCRGPAIAGIGNGAGAGGAGGAGAGWADAGALGAAAGVEDADASWATRDWAFIMMHVQPANTAMAILKCAFVLYVCGMF